MKEPKIKDIPKSFLMWGQWAIDDIKVIVLNSNTVKIKYQKYLVNAPTYEERISLSLIDKLFREITLEDKVKKRLDKIKNELSIENAKIKKLQEIQESLRV